MTRPTDRIARRDVVFRARMRVWCHFLNTRGRDAGLRSISDVGSAIQSVIGGRPQSWLDLDTQLPQMLRGILPRDWEKTRTTGGETRLEFLVNAIDAHEGYRGSKEVFASPLWPLWSSAAVVPQQLSESIDRALERLSLYRMSKEDSAGDWGIVNGSQVERVVLSVALAARRFSFDRSVQHFLGVTIGESHQHLLQALYVLSLLRLESFAVNDHRTASTVLTVIDKVTTSPQYKDAFGRLGEDVRMAFRSRVLWRSIEPLVDEPGEAKSSRSQRHSPEKGTTFVRVDRTRVGCVIAPVVNDPRQMDARTFRAITFGFRASG